MLHASWKATGRLRWLVPPGGVVGAESGAPTVGVKLQQLWQSSHSVEWRDVPFESEKPLPARSVAAAHDAYNDGLA